MKKNLFFLALSLLISVNLWAQVRITGKVTSSSGEPIPGVNVVIKGTNEGTITDIDGNYTIPVVSSDAALVYSFVGMLTEENQVGNQTVIDMILVEDIMALDEVVVIGYGTVKRRDLTGAVSSIKAEEIIKAPTLNAMEAIQGKVSGVDITRNSGAAGSGVTITVRGNRSIGDPNDAAGFRSLNSPLFIIDGVMGGSITDLNTNDIESIEVLKDASTTAIYGYQGANGVIIITTKKASAGKTKVSYNGYYGINGLTPYPEGRFNKDYIDLRREAYRTRGQWSSEADDPAIFSNEWDAIQADQWVNWTDLLLTNGSLQSHQISVSGGNDKTTAYLSAGYNEEVGPLKDNFSRYNARLNIDHNLNSWIKTGLQSQLTFIDQNRKKDAFGKANSATPLGTPYDETGQIIIYPIVNDNTTLSPITDLRPNAAVDNEIATRVFTNGYLEISPVDGLTYRSNLGVNLDFRRRGIFNDSASMAQINSKQNAASMSSSNNRFISWDNILTFTKELGEHSITLTTLSSYTKRVRDFFTASGTNQRLPIQLFYRLDATDPTTMEISSGYLSNSTMSFAGRFNYSFRGKYIIQGTYRMDGASQLASGHKWSSFPSVSAAWRISDENMLKNIEAISNLKLRASYGVAGIATIPPYGTQSSIIPSNNMSFGEVAATGYSYGELLSSYELEWERSKTWNLGLDIGLIRNRFNIVFDAYKTITDGNLFKKALPWSAGGMVSGNPTFSIWQNIGKTENKGVELELNTLNIAKSSFRWNTVFTFSRNREKILSLITDEDIINTEKNSLMIGRPIRSYYTYVKEGIWQIADSAQLAIYTSFKPGDIKLADLNNDSVIDATNDRAYIGSEVPDWTCGLQNTITYKGIDLSIFLFARWGQTIDNELLGRYNPSGHGNGPAYLDYWTPENPTNDFPRPDRLQLNEYTGYQTLTFVDGSYFKLKNITLGYTLPNKFSSKVFINKLRVYATASNILTITKSHLVKYYDPENKGSEKFPMSRQIVFGVNVDF